MVLGVRKKNSLKNLFLFSFYFSYFSFFFFFWFFFSFCFCCFFSFSVIFAFSERDSLPIKTACCCIYREKTTFMVIQHNISAQIPIDIYIDEQCENLIDFDAIYPDEYFYINSQEPIKAVTFYDEELHTTEVVVPEQVPFEPGKIIGCLYKVQKTNCSSSYSIITKANKITINVEYNPEQVNTSIGSSGIIAQANQATQGVLSLLQ